MIKDTEAKTKEKMQKTVDALSAELMTLRCGRANPHILDLSLIHISNAYSDSCERIFHNGQIGKITDYGCNNYNDNQRRKHNSQRCNNSSQPSGNFITNKRCCIYSDNTGGALAYGVIIHEFFVCRP